MSFLDRFPDPPTHKRQQTALEQWWEEGYEPTNTACGHMANDYDPHEPTKDKEETL
jgi:hypothetical protein